MSSGNGGKVVQDIEKCGRLAGFYGVTALYWKHILKTYAIYILLHIGRSYDKISHIMKL